MTPVTLLVEGSSDAVPWGPVLRFPVVMLFPIVRNFAGFPSFFFGLLPRAAGSPSMSPPPRALLRSFFAPASVHPQLVYLVLFCVSLLLSMVFLPCSDLRFPSRRGLPLGRVTVDAASVSLSPQGCFLWWYPFLYGSPICSSASFASKVLSDVVALWDESSFLWCLSRSGSFLQRFLFLLGQVAFIFLQSLPCYLSAVAAFGLCDVLASMDV